MFKNLPTVVIVGRINVGKSTLFNCLIEEKKAITSPVAGTTRDRNYGQVLWRSKIFNLIDTGGINIEALKNSIRLLLPAVKLKKIISPKYQTSIEKGIIAQTKKALEEADLILMVVDGQAGLLAEDKELAAILKKIKKPVVLVANKIDNPRLKNQLAEFYKLGLGQPLPVSAINGSGTGDLVEFIFKKLKLSQRPGKANMGGQISPIKVAIVGKPNVGKSSLLNQILGEERVIVSEIPQTTREPQDTLINFSGVPLLLIDTAGQRRKAKIKPGTIEKIANAKTLATIKKAEIILLVIDSSQLLTSQEQTLAGLAAEAKAGIILVANKKDLLPKEEKTLKDLSSYYKNYLKQVDFAPIIFVSAKTGQNAAKILELILKIHQERKKEIPQPVLDKLLRDILKKQKPPQAKGREYPHLYSIKQTWANPPEFSVFLGERQNLAQSFQRFIQNQIRRNFGFFGVPIKIKVRTIKK